MRAIVITRPGGPEVLELQERPTPEPGLGQVRVRVRASALNRADLMQRMGNYPAPPGAPADIPGMEYAGEVDAVGSAATLWPVGSRVMGIIGGGAHAEFVCIHEREVLPMPRDLSFEEAAAIPEVFLTAYDALFRQLDVRVGERVLVHAIGSGVGTAALQLARVAGATVYGTSRSPAKLERAKLLGLAHAIDNSAGDWAARVEALAGANAIHALVDLVGGGYLRDNLRVLAPRGRLVVVGLTAGNRAEIDLGVVLRKRVRIIGTALRSRAMEEKAALAREFSQRVVPMFDSKQLRPVIERVYPFAEISAAHEAMESNATFGKLVLRW
ncbi:MAG TPA: NAD(P)H-quinone oxidoreductase [Gemmatimonadaceae bacterium]|jgi:putative PIG3 family NAD(P)H quinone oxidoreductase|nr:NAD(P)H-quinone oxidoreductase [Gemmatimonadaceae bacterium]